MKKLLLAIPFALVMLAVSAQSTASAAESRNVTEQKATVGEAADQKAATSEAKPKPGDAKMKMMMPDFSFTCDRKRCACTGVDDCNDLRGSGLCGGGLSCNGEHCQCRR